MRIGHWVMVLVVGIGMSRDARAGIFSRKPKPDPAEHVPALIMQLKTDKDEDKRQNAAEELRNYDLKTFPEIMTVLIDALSKDTAVGVRAESASTIAKLRPISQQAGFALEQASANDPSLRVRMAAKQSLWQYHLVGYRSGKPVETAADPKKPGATLPPAAPPRGTHTTAKNPRNGESPEPPLADPGTTSLKPLTPVPAPKLLTPPGSRNVKPAPKPAEPDGPSLGPN